MYKRESAPPTRSKNVRPSTPAAFFDSERPRPMAGEPFGADGYIHHVPAAYGISVRAHGAPANTGRYSATGLANLIDEFICKNGIDRKSVKNIYLRSCYARSGGIFSQATALANITGLKVFAVEGKYRRQHESEMRATVPNRFSLVRALSKTGNQAMFNVVDPGVSLLRWARTRTAGSQGAVPRDGHDGADG